MKKYLKSYLITVASLFIAARLISTISFGEGEKTVLITAFVFTVINFFVKPVISLLLLPVNLITLGLFRWFASVFAFYLVILIVPQFSVKPFLFPGFSHSGYTIPPIQLSFFWTLVACSFIISFITSFLYWSFKK
ncbi:MAG TPA: phage holin family protein [Candidatus Bathyarchaeia archaeon]|nr:phage holin family protein [Candidatus Bathyarchaeia archaeon]